MGDFICPYTCSYRTNSGFCGYTGGHDACQWRKIKGYNYETNQFYAEPIGSYEEAYSLTPMTNADRIRSMSDEELAEYLDGVCHDLWQLFVKDPQKMWLDWLKSPVEGQT